MGQNGTRDALWRKGSELLAHSGASLELSSQLLIGLCWSWPRARTTVCNVNIK